MDDLKIRKANLSDSTNLAVLKQQVWIATYAFEGIRTELADYVQLNFTPQKTKAIIQDRQQQILIAERNGHLIGCVEILFDSPSPIADMKAAEIFVLYVLERFCGKGIGKRLVEEAISLVRQMNFNAVWLTVYYGNERAIQFYKRNQFKDSGIAYFEMNGKKYENRIMIRQIS